MNTQFINWLLFLINPFISMLLAFKDYTQPYAKNIFWAFCIFYGLTFNVGFESTGADIHSYVAELQYLYNKHEFTIIDIINYYQESGEIDVFRTFIAYVTSRFSNSQAILTTIYAIIFGFFYSRNIWYIFNLLRGKLNLITKLLLLALVLTVPIWYINGIRMYLAFHIFIYGLLPFIFENKKNKLIYIYLSFLVHFSFIIPISIFLLYYLVRNRINLFFIFFIFSLVISEIDIGVINQNIEKYLPEILIERTSGYRSEEVLEQKKTQSETSTKRWYVKWNVKLVRWSFYIMMFYFFIFGSSTFKISPEWKRLFSLNLLFFSVANILAYVPSGSRFYIISFFLSLIMIILYLNQIKEDYKFKLLTQILSPAFILFIIVSIRYGFYFTSITTVLGSPFIAIFNFGETMSLNDFIK